ncbi:MAG: tetratricopeptide repeat protein [Verrucomicrobiota bacterium]|nr:tetratricopeptide repeat protein [Verrucomicrobiota bacterium]
MKKSKIILPTLLIGCALLFSATRLRASTFDEANRAFADGHFDDATRQYETLIHDKGYSVPVLYNLANSYFRVGKIGPAILNYERAQVLAPNDPDIAANLSFARKQAGLFVQPDSWRESGPRVLSMNQWAWLGSVALVLLCASIVAGRIYPEQRLYLRFGTNVAALVLCAAAVSLALQPDTLDRAVVTAKEGTARISPFASAKSAFVLSAGDNVRIDKTHDGFFLVENRDRRSGWISRDEVARVIPRPNES